MTIPIQYLDYLEINREKIQPNLDRLIDETLLVSPVGNGYTDMIIARDSLEAFTIGLTELGLVIAAVEWWCHCTEESQLKSGCPHGYGGPVDRCGTGWFSEICARATDIDADQATIEDLKGNFTPEKVQTLNVLLLKKCQEFLAAPSTPECYTPGIWILVPDHWNHEIWKKNYKK